MLVAIAACTFDLASVRQPPGAIEAGTSSGDPSSSSGLTPPVPTFPVLPPFDSGVVRFNDPCTCEEPSPGGGDCPGTAAGCGWDLLCHYAEGSGGVGACVGPKCCDDPTACDADAAAMEPCAQGRCRSANSPAGTECIFVCGEKMDECGLANTFCTGCFVGTPTVGQMECLARKTCADLEGASTWSAACPPAPTAPAYYCR